MAQSCLCGGAGKLRARSPEPDLATAGQAAPSEAGAKPRIAARYVNMAQRRRLKTQQAQVPMRFLQMLMLAFVLLAIQGAGYTGSASPLSPGLAGASGAAFASALLGTGAAEPGQRDRAPHHCVHPCEQSAPVLRSLSANKAAVKTLPQEPAFYIASNGRAVMQAHDAVGSGLSGPVPDRAKKAALFARTGRQRL